MPKIERIRDSKHLKRLRKRRCVVPGCRKIGQHAHHVRNGAGTALLPGDDQAVSLCPEHHSEGHLSGWKTFEQKYEVDLRSIAARLWAESGMT